MVKTDFISEYTGASTLKGHTTKEVSYRPNPREIPSLDPREGLPQSAVKSYLKNG